MRIKFTAFSFGLRPFIVALLVLPLLAAPIGIAQAASPGVVYTQTNAAAGNAIVVYQRGPSGVLSLSGMVPTGGTGTGSGLGSQGSVLLSEDGQWLFAVNAGSNQISVFSANGPDLILVGNISSGGLAPISLTVYKNLLYVLNAGNSGSITGFEIGNGGALSPIPGSTQPLSNGGIGAAPGPAEVSISPKGDLLVVTEKATNLIDVYPIVDGVAQAPEVYPSSGATPFGFAFDPDGRLIVSEAFGGAPGMSAVSSYAVSAEDFQVISPSAPTHQTVACWVAISKDGKYAYTTNAGSGTISGYRIDQSGVLSLLRADGVSGITGAGSTPIGTSISNNGLFLYALNAGNHTLSAFQILPDGSLYSLGVVDTPIGTVGLAAQ